MNNTFNYTWALTVKDNNVFAQFNRIESAIESVNKATIDVRNSFNKSFEKAQGALNKIKTTAVIQQFQGVTDGLSSMSRPGLELSSALADLSAITGVTGKKLQEIEKYARDGAKTFGGSAADGIESYKTILSKLSPEIAKNPAALKAMGDNINILSKQMGGDAESAANVLTTALNQYQVSTDDPIAASKTMADMMNVMSAGAQAGSAELPEIASALEQCGMAAKTANVSFSETNAAIQVLDKAGKKGAEGGVALRNVLATLNEGRFLPKDVRAEFQAVGIDFNKLADKSKPLADRLNVLKPIMGDAALMTKLFGKENYNAALALSSNLPELQSLTKEVQGTTSAMDMAATIMESPAEKAKRLQARVDDLKLSFFNATGGVMGYVSVLGDMTRDVTNMVPLLQMLGTGIKLLVGAQRLQALWTGITSAATSVWTAVTGALSATMWSVPIVWIIAAIIALIAIIGYVVYKTDGWGKMWQHVVNGAKFIFQAFVESAKWQFNTLVDALMIGINYIKKGWYEFKDALGIGDSEENQKILTQIDADTEARKKSITDGAKKVADLSKSAVDEFDAAAHSLSWNKDRKLSDLISSKKKELGIAEPGATPGATTGGSGGNSQIGNPSGGSVGSGLGKKGNEAVATGGTKSTTVNITIQRMLEGFKITVNDTKEALSNIEDRVVEAVTRGVAIGASLGAN